MNKETLIAAIADRLNDGTSKAAVARVIDALQDTVIDAVADGQDVSLPGFVSFKPGVRAAREGRNPQTGETIQIAEKRVVKIAPLKKLKDALEG